MVRPRKRSLPGQASGYASSRTAQQGASVPKRSDIMGPMKNFSRPFYDRSNQENKTNTSMSKEPVTADADNIYFPTQGKPDRRHSHPLSTEALGIFQYGDFPDGKNRDESRQPNAPGFSAARNLLTRQTTPPASSPSSRLQVSRAQSLRRSVQFGARDGNLSEDIPGLCCSPGCPIQHAHYKGVYLYNNHPIPRQGPFGVSNPPPFVWAACYRLLERKEKREDFMLFWGFKRHHTADSWESFLRL